MEIWWNIFFGSAIRFVKSFSQERQEYISTGSLQIFSEVFGFLHTLDQSVVYTVFKRTSTGWRQVVYERYSETIVIVEYGLESNLNMCSIYTKMSHYGS